MNTLHDLPPLTVKPPRKWRPVYTIVERDNDKHYWLRVGAAFDNSDNSINLKLDALPVNGQLQIREHEPYDPSRRRGSDGGAA
jgi:hypothetical protein